MLKFTQDAKLALTCANASMQVEISLLVTWDITKLIVLAVSAVFKNLGPGDGGLALKNEAINLESIASYRWWLGVLHPFQHYLSHIETLEEW